MSDYKIIAKGLEEKLRARDLGLVEEGTKKLQLRRQIRINHSINTMTILKEELCRRKIND